MGIILSGMVCVLLLVGCQGPPKTFVAPKSYSITDNSETPLGRIFGNKNAASDKSGFYSLDAGVEAYVSRVVSVQMAQKTLDLQYYIWHDDRLGLALGHEIVKAADRGVRVRLLLDDLNIAPYEDALAVLDSHPQIEVRLFNPFSYRKMRFLDIIRFNQANKRMHGKMWVADNALAIIGGRNIGEEYFAAHGEQNFGDYDVLAIGPVVQQSSAAFDLYWNSVYSVPISVLNQRKIEPNDFPNLREAFFSASRDLANSTYGKEVSDLSLEKEIKSGQVKTFWGRAQVYYDLPEKVGNDRAPADDGAHVARQMDSLPVTPSKEIFIVSPYFIPGKKGVEYFKNKTRKGINVTVFTNSLASNDVPLTFAGYKKYRKPLLRAGVDLYELKPKVSGKAKKSRLVGSSGARLGLHGKVFAFDSNFLFVGSMNLDPRSIELNTELGVLIESSELTQQFIKNIRKDLPELSYKVQFDPQMNLQWVTWESANELRLNEEPEAQWWQSFQSGFLSLFVPEIML